MDLRESFSRAQVVTRKLSENIRAIQEEHHNADRKALWDDAHVFVKTVIQLSNVVKTYGSAHRLSAKLWKDIAKLTSATQVFFQLLQVSSYSPSATPRPYSPMPLSVGASALPHLVDEAKQGANLSRSRSAQPPASSRFAPHAAKAVPRSALPHQSFKIPATPPTRLGGKMRIHEDAVEGLG